MRIKITLKPPEEVREHPSLTVQGHEEPDPLPACTGQEAGKTPWTGHQSILRLKEAWNSRRARLRRLKMSAHDHARHVLSGSLAVRQMVLVFHPC